MTAPGPQSSLQTDAKTRRRGRMGLAPSWEHLPWWGIIILIVGVIVGFSVFTSARYQDALSFIFDLPWHKGVVKELRAGDLSADGSWSHTFALPLAPGNYTLYTEYQDAEGAFLGRGTVFKVQIAADATPGADAPMLTDQGMVVTSYTLATSTPTMSGQAPAGTDRVRMIDDFRDQPLRILRRIWNANGVILTLKVTFIAFLAAIVVGLLFGIMRVSSGSPDLREGLGRRLLFGLPVVALVLFWQPGWRTLPAAAIILLVVEAFFFLLPAMPYTISTLYVEIVRGVPMLVIILYMGFAVTPALRTATEGALDLRGLPAAVIGLAFGYGAYLAEVFRAGIESIPRGQMEAARSVGMNYFQAMRFIILPQAIRLILPPLGNDFIAMLKDSSLISVIALPEVLQQGRLWVSRNFRAFEGYNSVMLVYLVMTLLLSLLVRSIERRSRLPGK